MSANTQALPSKKISLNRILLYPMACLLSFQVFAFPSAISVNRIQLESGTNINLDRTSPPMAALEDVSNEEDSSTVEDLQADVVHEKEIEVIKLSAGKRIDVVERPIATTTVNIEGTQLSKNNPEVIALVASIKRETLAPAASIQNVWNPLNGRVGSKGLPERNTGSDSSRAEPETKLKGEKPKKYSYSGNVELSGVAFIGGEQKLTIAHVKNGKVVTEGKIKIQEGQFFIDIDERKGQLVAQLKDNDNAVIGEGIYALEGSEQTKNIKIKVLATTSGIRGQVISAYSYDGNKVPVKDAKVSLEDIDANLSSDEQGFFSLPEIGAKSVVMVRARAEGHWPTVALASAGKNLEVKLFPTRMMESFVELASAKATFKELKNKGVIWGQVTASGKPIAGAKVELAGNENLSPIYFNSMLIPDRKFNVTSENGTFAYLGVEAGLYQIRASVAGKYIDGAILPADAGHVSPVDLSLASDVQEVEIKFADIFNLRKAFGGVLKVLGIEDVYDVFESQKISLAKEKMLTHIEGHSSDYLSSRTVVGELAAQHSLMMVNKAWLNRALLASGKSWDEAKGAALIIADLPLETVLLNGKTPVNESSSIYFDRNGGIVNRNETSGSGGLLTFNLSLGINTILTKEAGKSYFNSHVIIVDPTMVNIIDLRSHH